MFIVQNYSAISSNTYVRKIVDTLCVISGFRREVHENCAILGSYATVSVIPRRRFGTTCRSYRQGPRIQEERKLTGFLTLEDGIDRLSRNVDKNYHYWPRNSPEERIFQRIES